MWRLWLQDQLCTGVGAHMYAQHWRRYACTQPTALTSFCLPGLLPYLQHLVGWRVHGGPDV
jgi:hypothetical protein